VQYPKDKYVLIHEGIFGGRDLNKLVMMLILGAFVLSAIFVRPVLSHPAEIRDVVPRDVGGVTYLNITVWHDANSSVHYVDIIEVTDGANTTSLPIDPQSLEADGTFAIDYNMGSVSGTPIIIVRARCTITGYSGAVSWTGKIPEFSSVIVLSAFIISTLIAIIFVLSTRTRWTHITAR